MKPPWDCSHGIPVAGPIAYRKALAESAHSRPASCTRLKGVCVELRKRATPRFVTLITLITRDDGKRQLACKCKLLRRRYNDNKQGDQHGDGLHQSLARHKTVRDQKIVVPPGRPLLIVVSVGSAKAGAQQPPRSELEVARKPSSMSALPPAFRRPHRQVRVAPCRPRRRSRRRQAAIEACSCRSADLGWRWPLPAALLSGWLPRIGLKGSRSVGAAEVITRW